MADEPPPTVGSRVSATLDTWSNGTNSGPISESLYDELLTDLEAAARHAVGNANLPPGVGPIRLSKGRIRQLLDCERHMIAMLDASEGETSPELVLGVLLDVLAGHRVTTGRLDDPPLDVALALLEATADRTSERVVKFVGGLDTMARSALAADLAEDRTALLAEWPDMRPEWWARVQERATLVLADGEVIIDGRCDMALGGPPIDTRHALIETKRREFRRDDLEDALLYALLVTLRDRVAPDCVITCCAQQHAVDVIWIGESELRSAAFRLTDALRMAGELAGGRQPTETRNPRCGWCPALAVCPTGSADPAQSGEPALSDFEETMPENEPF